MDGLLCAAFYRCTPQVNRRQSSSTINVARSESIAWMDDMLKEGIEYKIKIEADGTLTQVVGPSDHCKKRTLMILKMISWFGWLRPLV